MQDGQPPDHTNGAGPWLCENLLLGITGSLTATMMPHYIMLLRQRLVKQVVVFMSQSAQKCVAPYLIQLHAGKRVFTETFQMIDEIKVPHIEMTREADLFLIMPATANIIGKAANGICDDLISTSIVACPSPVVLVPSMNQIMWSSKAVQYNVAKARDMGYHVLDPGMGYQLADMQQTYGVMPPLEHILPDLREIVQAQAGARNPA